MSQTQTTGDVKVFCPEHNVVASNVLWLKQELQALVDQGYTQIAIDLSRVDMVDSKGLALLMLCYKSLSEKGGKLIIVTTNEDFLQLFKIMRLDEMFELKDSL